MTECTSFVASLGRLWLSTSDGTRIAQESRLYAFPRKDELSVGLQRIDLLREEGTPTLSALNIKSIQAKNLGEDSTVLSMSIDRRALIMAVCSLSVKGNPLLHNVVLFDISSTGSLPQSVEIPLGVKYKEDANNSTAWTTAGSSCKYLVVLPSFMKENVKETKDCFFYVTLDNLHVDMDRVISTLAQEGNKKEVAALCCRYSGRMTAVKCSDIHAYLKSIYGDTNFIRNSSFGNNAITAISHNMTMFFSFEENKKSLPLGVRRIILRKD